MSGDPHDGEAASFGQATRRGFLWSNAAFVATRSLSLVAVVVLARLLSPADFGAVAAVLVLLGVLELGSDLGMRANVIYEQERGITDRVQTAFTLGLLVAGALTLLGVLLAPLMAGFFRIDGLTGLFRLAMLNILLTALGNVHDALLLRRMALKLRTISELVRGAVRAAVSIALAFAGLGAASLVSGMLAGTLAWAVVLWGLTRFVPSLSFDRRIAKSMIPYGLGASTLDVLAAVTTRLDAVVIGRVLGSAALGLYSIAFRVPELAIQSIAWNLSLVVFPALSAQRVRDARELEQKTLTLVRFQALYALPVGAALASLAHPLIVVLFGPEWGSASGVLAAVAVMMAISSVVFPLGDLLKAVGRQRVLVINNIALIPAMVVGIVAAASAGIVAVSWVRAGSVAVFSLLLVIATSRSVHLPSWRVVSAAAPGLVAGAGVALGAQIASAAWSAPPAAELVVGSVVGAVVGASLLRALAPAAFGAVLAEFVRVWRRSSAASPPREAA